MREETKKYFEGLKRQIEDMYEFCGKARSLGLDPSTEVEAVSAGDLASRVEGLVGPPGVAEKLKEVGRSNITSLIDWLLEGINPETPQDERIDIIDQALRTTLAVLTEGVVAAPLEGISKVEIRKNLDGTQYLAIFFAGPIRSAGGTAQGLAVLVGEYIRKSIGLKQYRPSADETERYVEEIKLYHARCSRLQYFPSEEDVRKIVASLGVCVDGDPTERIEVSIHRNLDAVPSNRVRGGMCLVIAEGVAQKARKIMGYSKSINLDWSWLKDIGKGKKKESEDGKKETAVFMKELVGGRPVFCEPSAIGGFRLRYGRSRASGIAGKAIHPASMILLDGFPATGTQLKVERPGKGCIVTECDEVEGPIVKLDDGSLVMVDSISQANELKDRVVEITFLGDMLIPYGDFLQTNTKLLPAGYNEDWWVLEAREKDASTGETPSSTGALRISREKKIPLHPRYIYHWEDLPAEDILVFRKWVCSGRVDGHLQLSPSAREKRIMELLGVLHEVVKETILVRDHPTLLAQLGLSEKDGVIREEKTLGGPVEGDGYDLIETLTLVPLRRKSGTYIGSRMGRPEKARERKMKPPVHALFPIGTAGGPQRLVGKAVDKKNIEVDVASYYCGRCRKSAANKKCPSCGEPAILIPSCPSCGKPQKGQRCRSCKVKLTYHRKTVINLKDEWRRALDIAGRTADVKAVQGMISEYKVPEPLVKGLLRALNDVFVFKDGTIRLDATDLPLTHFKPLEAGVDVETLRKLGYTRDYRGKKLEREDQILELRVQDIFMPEGGAEYMYRATKFIDQMLEKYYGLPPVYGLESSRDIVGHLVVGLAPHTSAGVIGRIIGFNKAHGLFAHPYWHANKRRNADGDEDAIILLADVLLNFSRYYLPAARGGKMDAPLVVTTLLDPKEVDDEAHKIEVVEDYGLEFYEKTWMDVWPDEAVVRVAGDLLDDDPFNDLYFTHSTGDVTGPVIESAYLTSGNMQEKVQTQLGLAEKIRAVDEWKVANILINSHFLRDTYGNLRAFARQNFRCVKCNQSYRRPPLKGKCTKCGGRIILTVSKGNITKYLGTSIMLAKKYGLADYLKQRLGLLEREVESLFTNELDRQVSLSDYM